MGGCRCTYRNCTIRSDGATHMFHYPVFDKLRCHQWLTNAQRLDFLDLKVSQLKNRVVCQHHFKQDQFMNYMKDKLTFNAVPTENGPYCSAKDWNDTDLSTEAANILLDDIESDQLTYREKQANFSVKYGDFLVNNDLDTTPLIDNLVTDSNAKNVNEANNTRTSLNTSNNFEVYVHKCVSLPSEVNKKSQPMLVVPPYTDNDKNICKTANGKSFEIDIDTTRYLVDINADLTLIQPVSQKPERSVSKETKKDKIKILSEKNISTPVLITGELKPVKPSLVLNIPEKNKKDDDFSMQLKNMPIIFDDAQENVPNTNLKPKESVSQETEKDVLYSTTKSDQNKSNQQNNHPNIQITPTKILHDKKNKTSTPNATHLKNNMPPERIAAIQEKRNFNKKLRDMIEFCLDELDEREKSGNVAKTDRELNVDTHNKVPALYEDHSVSITKEDETLLNKRVLRGKTRNKQSIHPKVTKNSPKSPEEYTENRRKSAQKVGSCLNQEPYLSSFNEHCFTTLEARIKSMEETLIKRIDQNCHSILELKKTLEKKSKSTEQEETEDFGIKDESYKKRLFKDISKFLSPEANSLIYEELFINRYVEHSVGTSLPAKRRRR